MSSLWSRMSLPDATSLSRTPISLMVSLPPQPTLSAGPASCMTMSAASSAVLAKTASKPRFFRAETTLRQSSSDMLKLSLVCG